MCAINILTILLKSHEGETIREELQGLVLTKPQPQAMLGSITVLSLCRELNPFLCTLCSIPFPEITDKGLQEGNVINIRPHLDVESSGHSCRPRSTVRESR